MLTTQIKWQVFLIAFPLLFQGCGERGVDAKGPFKAYLLLQATDGKKKQDFYLGGYSSLSRCVTLIEDEIEGYDRDLAGRFYTNVDFTYGGHKTKSLTVEHQIIGFRCELNTSLETQ